MVYNVSDDGIGCPVFTNFNFDFTPNVGQTYIFGISGFASNTGNYTLSVTCTPFSNNNITSPPTSRPTLRPTILNTFTTLAPTKAPVLSAAPVGSILINGTTIPENITVCFSIFTPCINARVELIYIPIDSDGIDEPNEYIRVIIYNI